MYTLVKEVHSIIAFVVLLALSGAVIYSIFCLVKNRDYTPTNKILALTGLVSAHLQLVCGVLIYFLSPLGFSNFSGDSMKNPVARLYIMEHPLMMIIGIILITLGYSKAKRMKNETGKYKKIAIFYGIGLFLIAMRIPWDAWF